MRLVSGPNCVFAEAGTSTVEEEWLEIARTGVSAIAIARAVEVLNMLLLRLVT
jgi:hypothetical protein